MKKSITLFTFLLTFLAFSTNSYASFPVKKKVKKVQVVDENSVQVKELKEFTPAAYSGKSQVTAVILSALVGGLGIDRFYLGYTLLGILKLITFGGFGIWYIIDLILIATGELGPKNGAYSKTF